MTDIAHSFEESHGVTVELSFGASSQIQKQIERGVRADLYVSASSRLVDSLDPTLVAGPRLDLLANSLVVVTPIDNDPLPEHWYAAGHRIALAEAGVPVGDYARQALQGLDIWTQVEPHVVFFPHESAVLNAVAQGSVDWGVAYRSSLAPPDSRVREVALFPANSHDEIVYSCVILATSPRPEAAQAFATFLRSEVASSIFRAHGFLPLVAP